MTRGGIRPFAVFVAAILAVGALVACGDSESGTTSSSSAKDAAATQPVPKQPDTEAGSGDGTSRATSKKSDGSSESSSKVETAPLKVSGGGSAQYRVKGGDNSIQEFGEESDETELEEAAASLHDFYVARAEEDWSAACSHLSKTVKQQIKQLGSQSDKLVGEGCAGILSALTPPLPAKVQKELTTVDAGSLRTEGERSFLIYRGAEGAAYAISMTQEDAAWKVGALAAVPLS